MKSQFMGKCTSLANYSIPFIDLETRSCGEGIYTVITSLVEVSSKNISKLKKNPGFSRRTMSTLMVLNLNLSIFLNK